VQPDFVKLAEAFGAKGLRVTEPEQVGVALREAIDSGRPTVIDFKVSPEENVFPMVPAGQSITDLIGGKASRRARGAKS
jgi:acetolactate synthase-1/2/3 large subunit